jgi:predicted nucleotidyltransferase
MRSWLSFRFESVQADILCAFLYGSALRPKSEPRDVDIVVITRCVAESASWVRVRAFCEHLKRDFIQVFGLPLSVMIATQSEWPELDGVVVRERVTLKSQKDLQLCTSASTSPTPANAPLPP